MMMTATFATPLRMLYQIPGDGAEQGHTLAPGLSSVSYLGDGALAQHSPMSLALAATGRLSSVTNFLASSRISMMLFSKAKSGASGKEATNSVTNPNWMTARATTQTEAHHPSDPSSFAGSTHPTTAIWFWSVRGRLPPGPALSLWLMRSAFTNEGQIPLKGPC